MQHLSFIDFCISIFVLFSINNKFRSVSIFRMQHTGTSGFRLPHLVIQHNSTHVAIKPFEVEAPLNNF